MLHVKIGFDTEFKRWTFNQFNRINQTFRLINLKSKDLKKNFNRIILLLEHRISNSLQQLIRVFTGFVLHFTFTVAFVISSHRLVSLDLSLSLSFSMPSSVCLCLVGHPNDFGRP